MSTIRPGLPTAPPAQRPIAPDLAARAAQQAFFRAALDRAGTPTPVETTRIAPPAGVSTGAPSIERIARPGSLLDIMV